MARALVKGLVKGLETARKSLGRGTGRGGTLIDEVTGKIYTGPRKIPGVIDKGTGEIFPPLPPTTRLISPSIAPKGPRYFPADDPIPMGQQGRLFAGIPRTYKQVANAQPALKTNIHPGQMHLREAFSPLYQISEKGYQNILRHAGWTGLYAFGGYHAGAGAAGLFGADEDTQRFWGRIGAGAGAYAHITRNILGRDILFRQFKKGSKVPTKYTFKTSTDGTFNMFLNPEFAGKTLQEKMMPGRSAW